MPADHPTIANGKICYLEIPSTDPGISATFYNSVFGWNIRRQSNGHVSFDDAVNEVSGRWVTGRAPASQPGLLVYIMVINIEDTIQQLIAAGGTLVQQVGMDSPEITARFTDPAGNLFGLYQEPAG